MTRYICIRAVYQSLFIIQNNTYTLPLYTLAILLINAHPVLVYHVNYDTELARIRAIVYQSNTPNLYKSFVYLFGNMCQ